MVNNIIDKVLDKLETTVCNIAFAIMCTLVFLQIILRVIGEPLVWSEEISRYLFIWVIYLAASKAVKNGRHLSVGILPLVLPEKGKQVLFILANVFVFIFFIILCYNCFILLERMSVRPQFAPASGLNMIYAYAAPAVGSVMMTIRCIQNLVRGILQLFKPDHEKEVA